jgi:membrane AbrB-like protein
LKASGGPLKVDRPALARAIGLGIVGGAIFAWLGLPLAWMLGAMAFTTVAAVSGVRVAVPNQFRNYFVAVLGLLLGSAFTPELLGEAGRIAAGLAVQAGFIVLVTAISYVIYSRVGGYDRVTAYFSSTPGGLSEMTLLGDSLGGDVRTISLNHAVRVLLVVCAIPFYFRFIQHVAVPSAPGTGSIAALQWTDVAILGACGVIGYVGAKRLRLPAAALIGPLFLSAAVHLGGLTSSSVPAEIAAVAQIVVGAAIGGRFAGVTLSQVGRIARLAVLTSAISIGAAVVVAEAVSRFTTINLATLFLGLAPGGLAEMSLIALALGVDTAFVTVMHFFRVAMIMLLAPQAFRLLPRPRRSPSASGD